MARASATVRRGLRAAARRLPDVFVPGQRVLVAFSGGQDSTCLLHALAQWRPELELAAVHVDHALRATSAADAALVAERGASLGVSVHVVRVDVAAYRSGLHGWSVQQAARAARYHALASVARRRGAAAVLVAHTADDQAETLLLNLLRGTGLAGVAGMRMDESLELEHLGPAPPDLADFDGAGGSVRVARPLLGVARSVTLAYCAEFGLSIVEDASNLTRAYTRNRVRHDLLPALERFNPAIRAVLARTADLAAEDVAALDGLVAASDARLRRDAGPGLIAYDRLLWRVEHRAFQRRLLRGALAAVVGRLVDVHASPIEDALDLIQSGTPGQAYHLPYGVELRLESERFVLDPHGRARQPGGQPNNGGAQGSRV